MKEKNLQIHLTESEYAAVREAARRAGKTASQFGAEVVMGVVLENSRKNPEVLDAIQNFQRLFCEAMELSLTGKLTPARLQALAERRSLTA